MPLSLFLSIFLIDNGAILIIIVDTRTIILMILFSQYLRDAWIPIPGRGGVQRYFVCCRL
jgi:hypothetical protein